MILSVYVVLNLLCVFVFFKVRNKRLHPLEIGTYWIFCTLLVQNYYAFNHINFKLIVIPDIIDMELAHLVNRTILEPLLFVWFLAYYAAYASSWKRALLAAAFLCLLVGQERFAVWLGVFRYNGWTIWGSFAVWLASILLSIAFMSIFRKKLVKKGVTG
jgi:hypothetical protein